MIEPNFNTEIMPQQPKSNTKLIVILCIVLCVLVGLGIVGALVIPSLFDGKDEVSASQDSAITISVNTEEVDDTNSLHSNEWYTQKLQLFDLYTLDYDYGVNIFLHELTDEAKYYIAMNHYWRLNSMDGDLTSVAYDDVNSVYQSFFYGNMPKETMLSTRAEQVKDGKNLCMDYYKYDEAANSFDLTSYGSCGGAYTDASYYKVKTHTDIENGFQIEVAYAYAEKNDGGYLVYTDQVKHTGEQFEGTSLVNALTEVKTFMQEHTEVQTTYRLTFKSNGDEVYGLEKVERL